MNTVGARRWLGLFILAALVAVLARLTPPYWESLQFSQFLQSYVASEAVVGRTAEMIQVDVANRAVQRGLPVRPGDVSVRGSGETLQLEVRYQVAVDLLLYTVNLHLRAKSGA